MAPSCWFFWAWWLALMLAFTAADQHVEGCSGSVKRCGNLTISDPFWLTDIETGRSCGSPDFEVTCFNNTPVLQTFAFFGFAIIHITYEERSLRAVDLGKLELLPVSNGCQASTWNTSNKLGHPFRIGPVNLNLILYNCTSAVTAAVIQDGGLVETRIRCGNSSKVFVRMAGSYDETSDNPGYAVEGCKAIVVPVLAGANGEANASDYEQLISNGFLLTWDGLPPLPLARKFAHPSSHL